MKYPHKLLIVKPASELRTVYGYLEGRKLGLRFGQWICNAYLLPNTAWPELYYADDKEAMDIIDEYYAERAEISTGDF